MAKVLLKNSFTAASVPAGLSAGELAVNVTDRKLFVGNAVGGVVTLIDPNALVTSVNGATGAITDVARTNQGNTFSVRQVMNAGITTANLYVTSGATFISRASFSDGLTASNIYASSGVTFNSTSAHTGLATFSAGIIATDTTDGIGVISTKGALDTSPARNGAIRLGYVNGTPQYNTLLHNASGLFTIYNGFSTTGSNLLNINSTVMNVNVPVSGMTFIGNITAPNIVTGISGATGPINLVAGTNITIAQSGKTFTFSSSSSGGTQVGVTSSDQLFDVDSWAFSYCDFHGGPGPFGTILGASGGDVIYYVDSPATHMFNDYTKYTGLANLRTGAIGSYVALGVATPSASYTTAVGAFSMANAFEFRTRISSDNNSYSTATNTFIIYAGVDEQYALYPTFNTNNGAAVWFEYNYNLNSGNWTTNFCEYFGRTASTGTTFAYSSDCKMDIIKGSSGGVGYIFMHINGVTVSGYSYNAGLLGVQPQGNARIVVRRTTSTSATRRTFVDYLSILQRRG